MKNSLENAINITDIQYALTKLNMILLPEGSSKILLDLFLNSPVICCLVNSYTGTFDLVNLKFMEVLGWDLAESTSKPFIEFIYPSDKEITFKTYSIYHSETENYDERNYVFFDGYFFNRYLKKDGGYKWLKWGVSNPMITYGKDNKYSLAMAVPVDTIPIAWIKHIKNLFNIDLVYNKVDISIDNKI